MDRNADTSGSYLAATTDSGWDPHAVWEQRVRAVRTPRPPPSIGAVDITVTPASAGWDPIETWRGRVRGARHSV